MLRRHSWLFNFLAAFVAFASSVRADVFHMAPGLTSVDFVTVGNPGNAPDTRYNSMSVGSVNYAYQIGKYEVTAGQYTEFLNAVAKSDPNGLYDLAMGDPSGMPNSGDQDLGANIQRSGSSPNYSYSVALDWANRPVNNVTFWDAARFCNWLHNGQPTGPQGSGTTEDGAYHDVGSNGLFGRNPGARFFIPTDDEWYKAAYHDKSAGLAGTYFDYPTSPTGLNGNTLPDLGGHANYDEINGLDFYTIGRPYWRTEVGTFINSPSRYGTFDQAGNVQEWVESLFFGFYRGLRGGDFSSDFSFLQASKRALLPPVLGFYKTGFRVAAAVPEPSTAALAVVAWGVVLLRRSRTRS
jgi:sulfatase modifying factor 1